MITEPSVYVMRYEDDDCPNSFGRQKDGSSRGGKGGTAKKGRTHKNSDARRGRSHRCNLAKDVGCEEQEKI